MENKPMHPPTFSTKAEARAWGLQRRAAIPAAEREGIGAKAIARLIGSPLFSQADALLTYVGSKGTELDTRPLIDEAIALGKTVLVPVTRPGGVMLWSRLERLSDLEMTSRGILEPRPTSISWVKPAGGLCVVPGVCFRHDGHRIGFGGGYYDRFLDSFAGNAIALAPEALFGVDFPVEAHDRPVSVVFTETGAHAAV
jgi:5-formyltetrahydrofolate cyclo-ligase